MAAPWPARGEQPAVSAAVLLKVGVLGRSLRERPELRAEAEAHLRAALAVRGERARVSLNAAIWIVSARA